MPVIKRLFFDVETTGTDWRKHGVHQFSAIIDIQGEEVHRFDVKLQPNPKAEILDSALAIAGVTRETLATYQSMERGFKQILSELGNHVEQFDSKDKFNLVGFRNSSFDNFFLREMFSQNNDKYYGSWFYQNTIDVATLASQYFISRREEIENFKLSTIAKHFGIEVEENRLHDALYDVELTREVYYFLTED